jgi:hypothetical protein
MKKPYQIEAQRAVRQLEEMPRMEIRRCKWILCSSECSKCNRCSASLHLITPNAIRRFCHRR